MPLEQFTQEPHKLCAGGQQGDGLDGTRLWGLHNRSVFVLEVLGQERGSAGASLSRGQRAARTPVWEGQPHTIEGEQQSVSLLFLCLPKL